MAGDWGSVSEDQGKGTTMVDEQDDVERTKHSKYWLFGFGTVREPSLVSLVDWLQSQVFWDTSNEEICKQCLLSCGYRVHPLGTVAESQESDVYGERTSRRISINEQLVLNQLVFMLLKLAMLYGACQQPANGCQ